MIRYEGLLTWVMGLGALAASGCMHDLGGASSARSEAMAPLAPRLPPLTMARAPSADVSLPPLAPGRQPITLASYTEPAPQITIERLPDQRPEKPAKRTETRQTLPVLQVATAPPLPVPAIAEKPQPSPDRLPPSSPAETPKGGPDPLTLPPVNLGPKLEEPLVSAIRCILDRKPAEAVELLRRYDKPTQEALLCLLPLAVRLTEQGVNPGNPQAVAATLDELQSLSMPLRQKAALRIDRLCFCRHIRCFGSYDPVSEERPAFRAGCDGRPGENIQVYAEVRNFASEAQGAFHVTRLASAAEIRTLDGKAVWHHDFEAEPDVCRSPRTDYFITYRFCVPPQLPPGPYTLWIHVRDTLSKPHRDVRRSLDFQIVPCKNSPQELKVRSPAPRDERMSHSGRPIGGGG